MSISLCPGTQRNRSPNIRRSPVYRIAVMWSFSLWSPEDTSWLWRQLSNAPCLGYFGIYLVNPQHRQCPAVYTSGRTSSFQQQKHMECPSSDLSLYRSSGTAKHWQSQPSVQVPYWVCCAVYHTSLILLGFRPSEIVRGYLWKCLCESQCQWHMRLTHILHLKVPYEECLRIVQHASKQYVGNI